MPTSLLEGKHAELADTVTQALCGRATGSFRRVGEQACRRHVDAALTALREDLSSGKREAVRTAMQTLVEELSMEGLTFADLRFFAQTLRRVVRAALESDELDGAQRQRLDDWFFELVLVTTMRFVAQHNELHQKQTAKLEVQRLESQLEELETALEEKTRLLELIRQASTPIAPIAKGILVVPLVGTFDTFRAELLTEKLLEEVARLRARAVLLDISGVPVVDSHAAELVIRLARAVRLLGTELLLVGLSPAGAQTIVQLGIDLSSLKTYGTLQDGLAHALVLRRLKLVPL